MQVLSVYPQCIQIDESWLLCKLYTVQEICSSSKYSKLLNHINSLNCIMYQRSSIGKIPYLSLLNVFKLLNHVHSINCTMYKRGSIRNIPDLTLLNEFKLFNDETNEDLI